MQCEQEPQDCKLVHTIHKGPKQQVRISLSTFRGRTFADLRQYVLKQDQWIPTPKGCTIDVAQLEELEEAVMRLRDASSEASHPF